jgi:hypothetical protein
MGMRSYVINKINLINIDNYFFSIYENDCHYQFKKEVNIMIRVQALDTLGLNPISGRGEGFCTFCHMGARPSFSQRGLFGRHNGNNARYLLYLGYPVYGWWGVGSRPEKELSEAEKEEDIFS